MEIRNRITRLEQIAWRDIQPLQPEDLKHVVNFGDVEASIKKHGIANPFAVWQDADGTVYAVDGHIRKEVLHNMEGVPDLLPAFFVDAKNREEAITILLEVYNVNANPIDQEALVKWLEVERIEVEQIAVKSLDVMRVGEEEKPKMSVAEEDDFDEQLPSIPKTVPGDLYEIGPHRLLCGDSTDSDAVERLMGGEKADMVFTSPPYNQGGGGMKYDYKGKLNKLYEAKSDERNSEDYFEFCLSVLNTLSIFVKSNGAIFWNVMYNAKSRDDYGKIIFSEKNPFRVQETIVWDKTHPFPIASKGILSRRAELVFLLSQEKYFTNQGDNEVVDNFWQLSSNGSQQDNHKACFPVGLPEKGMNLCSQEKDMVYDPFLGSGSTMVAAHQINRRCFGMELHSGYCDYAVKRMLALDKTLTVKRNGIDVTQEFIQ